MGKHPKWRTPALAAAALASSLMLAPAALATHVYVSNYGSGTISPFSVNPNGSMSHISCSGSHCHTGSNPGEVAMTPDGRFLYAVNEGSGTVSPFSVAASGSLTPVTTCSSCTTGSEPFWMAISPNGKFLYASNYNGDTVSPFKINANGTLTHIVCGGTGGSNCKTASSPQQPAVSPNGKFLYVPAGGVTVDIFSIATGGSLTPVTCPGMNCSTGNVPYGDAVTPNGKFLYVANIKSGTVSAYSIASNGHLAPITCPGCTTGSRPEGVAVTPNGRFLYVTNESDGTVSAYSIASNGSLTKITCSPVSHCATGTEPTGVTASPSGRFLYVTNYSSDTVSVFSIGSSGALTPVTCSPCATGSNPWTGPIVVSPDQAPVASFTATARVARNPSSFNGAASKAAAGQSVASYAWSFGDGKHTTTTGATVTHTYTKPGKYTVTLMVTDNNGCSTALIFTGQSAYCNGGPKARTTRQITVRAPRRHRHHH